MIKMTDFDLRLLRIFKTVTDCGGLSAAESALNMNLSTISTHIADLESRVGIRLCERGRRGFRLTVEGSSLYQATERLLDSVEEFRAGLGALRHQLSGELTIGIVDNTITDQHSHIATAIRAVKQRSGDLHIKLEIKSPVEIEEAIQERRLHVGIGPFRNVSPGLTYEPLYTEELHLYCGKEHPIFASAPMDVEMDSLRELDYVARGYMREAKEWIDASRIKVAATVYHMEAVAVLVLSGKFVGYLPTHYAAQWVQQQLMRPLRPDVLSHHAAFSLVTRKDREPTLAVQVFVEALRADLSARITS
ncbi:LysR family transcriptional regulator [Paraburkholderia phytofirmans]|uniref:LysR family transcriptional regulator n=1 Tax=Paraburkholderia phytofirmans TaxID=261302 RepID=A0ABW9BFR4_9BURK